MPMPQHCIECDKVATVFDDGTPYCTICYKKEVFNVKKPNKTVNDLMGKTTVHQQAVEDYKKKNEGGFAPITVENQREQIEKQRQEIAEQRKKIQEMIDG